ncbi:hypothetical protein AB0953_07845 [Streptomyces sp. NPDC046866]|uniref:hypothetical protein n=1 Tax=Streptomyces sp. NPDC046866 TaxID=3154921 RepID=UPI0034562DD7
MADFLVNTTTRDFQFQPFAAAQLGTAYAVVWADGSDASIKGQLLAADGSRIAGEFTVNAPTPTDGGTRRAWPAFAFSGSNTFAVWVELPSAAPPPAPGVKLQRFFDGQRQGPESRVNTSDIDPRTRPALTRTTDGGCMVVWLGGRPDRRVLARRFDAEGEAVGPEFVVNTVAGEHTAAAAALLSDGNHVVAWNAAAGERLTLRFLDSAADTPRAGEISPNLASFGGRGALAPLDDGRFVLAHLSRMRDSDLGEMQSTVVASVFDADGAEVAAVPAGEPRGVTRSSPAVAALPQGRFLLGWVERSAVSADAVPAVRAQLCSVGGGALGEPVAVSTARDGVRFQLCAATACEGDGAQSALLVWADNSPAPAGDTSAFSVRGRAFGISAAGNNFELVRKMT